MVLCERCKDTGDPKCPACDGSGEVGCAISECKGEVKDGQCLCATHYKFLGGDVKAEILRAFNRYVPRHAQGYGFRVAVVRAEAWIRSVLTGVDDKPARQSWDSVVREVRERDAARAARRAAGEPSRPAPHLRLVP